MDDDKYAIDCLCLCICLGLWFEILKQYEGLHGGMTIMKSKLKVIKINVHYVIKRRKTQTKKKKKTKNFYLKSLNKTVCKYLHIFVFYSVHLLLLLLLLLVLFQLHISIQMNATFVGVIKTMGLPHQHMVKDLCSVRKFEYILIANGIMKMERLLKQALK